MIRPYEDRDETPRLRCRVVAFPDTAYLDSDEGEKEHDEHPSIELVAGDDGEIVGLIDFEFDVCSDRPGRGAMIWHVAVLPDYRRPHRAPVDTVVFEPVGEGAATTVPKGRARARRGGCGSPLTTDLLQRPRLPPE